ncbi:MAG TPA: alpha-glucosidase [Candidatus Nanopelagicales bacterium]|nr:alpha-glucosidase [Candidatus Nanopelagicales bacterium]
MADSPWWQTTSIYQVYPRSYQDSDADGIGDLPGIIDRLDYIRDLGVETVWVSPFFASPQMDFGYDVTDYEDVAPEYGTLEDAQRLIDEAHARGLRVMFDLVLNHTSDQHPWFQRSRSSRTNPKADWYIWADGRGRHGRRPPNNWKSAMEFTSAWQYSPIRKQWYLCTFLPFQPDLNWRNPQVKAAMFDSVRFWLDKGVDGFRLDIFGSIMKNPSLANNPVRPRLYNGFPRLTERINTENTPDNIRLAKELRAVVDEYDGDRVLLGEVFGSPSVLKSFLGDDDGLQLVFLFDFLTYQYDADWFARTITEFDRNFPAPQQPTYVLENHDRSRTIDRVHGDRAKAAVLAVILLTVRGVPTVYMGQEIGMSNTPLRFKDALDPVASTVFRRLPQAVADRMPERLNRDEMRTPMQWDASAHAGFCPDGVSPWLPVNPDYRRVNVASQRSDPDSMLALYRRLFALRREHESLRTGSLALLEALPPGVLGYRRNDIIVLANLGEELATVRYTGEVLADTGQVAVGAGRTTLFPDSAVVLRTVVPRVAG